MNDSKQMKIFIVEDDKFYANLVRETLKKANYDKVIVFDNGDAFLDSLYRAPDVVILDYMLDRTNGIDLLRKIKSVNPDIQVIFLSGQEDLKIAINSLKYGAFDYLEKNEDSLSKLLFIIDRIEQHTRLTQESRSFKLLKKLVYFSLACVVGVVFYLSGHLQWQN